MSQTLPWWKKTVIYQIYPRSFADSNGDGIGDLRGIIQRLDYLHDLGVETLWLSPFFASPQRDIGYDISDYQSVSPDYGTLEDADALIAEAHARGLRVVLDMVLNHTSDEHPWFRESRQSRDNPKRDWYIWRDGRRPGGKAPPNNWRSMIGGSGWHYDEVTNQWYWAQFLPFQPDLNYRNPQVVAAMLESMRFWLQKGVDGFRLDIVNALFEDAEFRDNPFAWTLFPADDDPAMFFHSSSRTLSHPDTLAFMKVLRQTVDEFDDPSRFLVGEVIAPMEKVRAHCLDGEGLNLVFLFKSLTAHLRADALRELIHAYEAAFAEPLIPTWVFSNHDRARRISRLGGDRLLAKLNAAWQLTARGVPCIYYGEEIGMQQQRIPVRRSQDALARRFQWLPQLCFDIFRGVWHESINRDECRTPMQWEASPHGGFCSPNVTPWLPVGADLEHCSVATEQQDSDSLFHCYRRFLNARRASPALHAGNLRLIDAKRTGRRVVGYIREAPEQTAYVLLNCGQQEAVVPNPAPGAALVVSTTIHRPGDCGDRISLGPWEGLVLVRGEGR